MDSVYIEVLPLTSYQVCVDKVWVRTVQSQRWNAGFMPERKRAKPRFRAIGQKEGLVLRVVRSIEDQILRGKLEVGVRLPPEREFSEQLGVSRPVVREAVRILTAQGLLETRHGIGTTVKTVGRDDVVKPLRMFLRIRGEDISVAYLHQVRSILEIENAGLAAEQGRDEDVDALAQICREMEQASDIPELFALKDSEFHRRLSETTHNPLLILLLDSVHDMMSEVRELVAHEAGLFDQVMPTHIRIVESVRAHDPAAAREAMREHLSIALNVQIAVIEKQKNGYVSA
jgi:GntR family transcriptional repressor for pyruvate dehydrogenase complex